MAREKNPYVVDDFQGIIQRQDPDKIPENFSPLLINISLDKPGTWMKRKGTDLLSTTQVGNGVYGLIDYIKNDNTNTITAIRDEDLQTYSEATDEYATIDASQFTESTFISSTNYLNRVYHVSESDFLCYETGGACTEVGTGSDRIKAQTVMTAQNTLFVAGVTYGDGSAQTWQDRVYYSLFDTTNNVPTDQLWNDSEGSLGASTRFFGLLAPHKASIAYQDFSYHFTENTCSEFDIASASLRKIFDVGCAGPRAVTNCNGWMIWASPDGRLWGWGGAGPPMPLSWGIEDDGNSEAIINSINKDDIPNIALGSVGSKFWASIGDITVFNETIENACVVGLITQNLENVLWSLESFSVKPQIFANVLMNGKPTLLFGCEGVDDIYEMNTGSSDVGPTTTAISAKAKMSFIDFKTPFSTKMFNNVFIKFRPQSTENTYLKLSYAMDGETTYTPFSDPDGTPALNKYGVINMYTSDANTDRIEIKKVNVPQDVKGHLLSIEFANSQIGENFEIQGIGINFQEEAPLDIRVDV